MKKIIVLTGVTRGCGLAMARKFAILGHTVVGCGRTSQLLDVLRRQLPSPHDWSVVDVTDSKAVEQWAKGVISRLGAPHILINNAAVINPSKPLWEVTEEEFSNVIDINIKGMANTIRAYVPSMIGAGQGVIVNFSSGWGRSTSPEVAPYCATKWAVEGLTQALAQELPSGLAAIPLNPGIINTEMLQSCFGTEASSYPTPTEWAETAVPYILGLGPRDNGRSLSVPG